MHAKAQALKDEIDRLLPAGTPRSRFIEFARTRAGWLGDGGDGYYISVGQEPSRVWYCGPWEVGVLARFTDDRLTVTEVSTWGLNCP